MKPDKAGLASFLSEKNVALVAFEKAMLKVLQAMGPDVQGISWFSAGAEHYVYDEKEAA